MCFRREEVVAAFLEESGLANPVQTVANLHTRAETCMNEETLSEEEQDLLDLEENLQDQ